MGGRHKKHEHEDHVNHEAWAIPYGDLVTLLLAFFVVMYAVSSVNEGKYRVLSDSMQAAFRGSPKTLQPISIGDKSVKVRRDDTVAGLSPSQVMKLPDSTSEEQKSLANEFSKMGRNLSENGGGVDEPGRTVVEISEQVAEAMAPLIEKDMVKITRKPLWVEVEFKTDLLFPSGSADIQQAALPIMDRMAAILAPFNSPVRVEGHTDNRPIRTALFPSNWELSGARAARIVRLFESRGIAPARLSVAGQGEHQPVADNATVEGRNRNRRVTLVILDTNAAMASEQAPTAAPAATSDAAPAAESATPAIPVATAAVEAQP